MIKEIKDIDYVNTLSQYQIIRNPFTHVLVYQIEEIVAFLDYSVIYDKIEINYLFVKEAYRDQHLASTLLQYMMDRHIYSNVTLEVRVDNEVAIHLYQKFGFQIVTTRKNYYGKVDAYLMEVKNENFSN